MKYTTGLSGNCVDLYDALVTTHHTQEHIKKTMFVLFLSCSYSLTRCLFYCSFSYQIYFLTHSKMLSKLILNIKQVNFVCRKIFESNLFALLLCRLSLYKKKSKEKMSGNQAEYKQTSILIEIFFHIVLKLGLRFFCG